MWFLGVMLAIAWIGLPLWSLAVAISSRREISSLRERVRRLETERAAAPAAVAVDLQAARAGSIGPTVLASSPAASPATTPAYAAPVLSRVASAGTTVAQKPPAFFDSARAEELVGGLWLQNVGAVILLLGAFFSIVWGYTSGRLGPGVLVGAGVLLGLALVWRGDRLARTLPSIGHALIGLGSGVAYLSIYLGWFTLHVLPPIAALALLTLVALGTLAAGLWYRAQAVAALGVIGAFVPQLLVGLLQLRGFSLTPPQLLGYLAFVNVVVFVLAARAEWSLLDLLALMLTTVAWIATFPNGQWGWALQCGLALVYVVGGLAPVARHARRNAQAPPATLAVIVSSPVLFALMSWPFIEVVGRIPAAMMLLSLALIYVAAAWWVDLKREPDDIWRALTAAATLFVTFALERLADPTYLSLMWLTEGTALVWLGGSRRGAWLRGLGAVVAAAGACAHLTLLYPHDAAQFAQTPFLHVSSLRALAGIALVFLTGALLRRESGFGDELRRLLSRSWVVVALLMLLVYSAEEADHLARALEGENGRWARLPGLGAPPAVERIDMLRAFVSSVLWTLQAAGLMIVGWTRRSAFMRWLGLGLLGLTVLKFALSDLAHVDVFWRFVSALLVGVTLLLVSYFYQRRMRRERGAAKPISS